MSEIQLGTRLVGPAHAPLVILERHFTDSMTRPGPDIVCSMDPEQCRNLIEGARTMQLMRGGAKGPAPEEQVTMDFAFATLVTIAPVRTGEVFTEQNLWAKRPGIGAIPAERYEQVLGRRARRDIESDTHLAQDDID